MSVFLEVFCFVGVLVPPRRPGRDDIDIILCWDWVGHLFVGLIPCKMWGSVWYGLGGLGAVVLGWG